MRGNLFSAKAEYACISMLELAAQHGKQTPVRLKDISEAHGIDCGRFLVQILLQLKGAGLVASTRGAAGGYNLARPPEQISLADIINVIDPIDPLEETNPDGTPPTPLVRTVRGVWSDILEARQRVLETTSLADLLQRAQSSFELIYQI
jgi:Rrf2 family transcriptional regulator, cysteine metabolism repressor